MNSETIETILRWALAILPSIITILLFWLRSGSSVTVRLIQNPTAKIGVRIRGLEHRQHVRQGRPYHVRPGRPALGETARTPA